jgi:hypothetical protein
VSVRVMAAVWELDLPPMEKLVLLALADWSNDEGKCWPSATRLAAKTGEGERTVRRVIQSLIGKGFLYQELRSGTSPIYTVDPCQSGTPARVAPLPHRPQTPARAAPNTLGTVISSEPNGSSPKPWACPVGVDRQVWADFLGNRKRKRQGNSVTAWKRFNDDLARISMKTGIPPPKLIEDAAASGWAGIYDPNSRSHANDRPDNPTAIAVQRLTGTFGSHG